MYRTLYRTFFPQHLQTPTPALTLTCRDIEPNCNPTFACAALCCIVLHYAALINPLSALSPPLTRKVVTALQKSGVAWNNQYKTMSLNPQDEKKMPSFSCSKQSSHPLSMHPCQLPSFLEQITVSLFVIRYWRFVVQLLIEFLIGSHCPYTLFTSLHPPLMPDHTPSSLPHHFCPHHFLLHPSPSLFINGNIRIRFHLAWVLYSFSFAFYPVDQTNSLCDFDVTKNQIPSLVSNSYFTSIANGALLS